MSAGKVRTPADPPPFSEVLGVFGIIGLALYAADPGLAGLFAIVFGIPVGCYGLDRLTAACRGWLQRLGLWEP